VGRSDVGPRAPHLLGIVVISLRGASGNTLYWVLLLMWGLGQHTSLGIVVGLCGASGNSLLILGIVVSLCALGNTLLGFAVGLCGASGNTPIHMVLLVYVASRATHFTGYCCWFIWGALLHLGQHTSLYWVMLLVLRGLGQHTLLGRLIVVGYAKFRATHFTGHH
jgi:hypothetical protein